MGQHDPRSRESVIVVMDANKTKGTVDALEWAIKQVVRRGDTVIVLGVLCDLEKRTSCFPLNIGVSISGIWERLEFSSQGQGEVRPRELVEEIERKRLQYQKSIQPFYRQCKKYEVTLEVKIAFGFNPERVTIEQAQSSNPRWIVLDSNLKKYKIIHSQVGCNVAVMKRKDVATLMPSKAPVPECAYIESLLIASILQEGESSTQPPPPQSPSWYPLSWRSGYPRSFTQPELEMITNNFSEENVVIIGNHEVHDVKVYEGRLQDTPVLVKSFRVDDERFWTMLKILSRVRHRNIMNLVGYCCTESSMFLLCDYPCMGTLEMNLQQDESARNLSWKARWHIAVEIGGSLRYLHEECADGAIVHLSVCSSHVVFSHGCSAMLSNFITAKWLKGDIGPSNDDSQNESSKWRSLQEEERLSIDIRGYGMFLIELITGKSARLFQMENGDETLIKRALPLIENDAIREVMDPRLEGTIDTRVVGNLANAALHCLKNDPGHRLLMSEVLSVVRGNQLAGAKS